MTHSTHRSVVALAALSLTLLCAPLPWGANQAQAAVRIQPAASQQAGDTDGSSDKVAQGATAAQQDLPDTSKLTAVHASDLKEGTYTIEVASSSSMFRITEAKLTVADGKMTCELTMSGKGYGKLFMGTGEQAAQADEKDCIPYVDNAGGTHSFTVPVEALNTEIDCAAWSIKKESWYDRTLVFLADTLKPAEAALADGTYTASVALEGGTGRASVETPCTLKVEKGAMTATVVWSSPNYDQMVVNGTQYLPVNKTGNSTFEIPVAALDTPLAVQAETCAMSEPHMIDYTLTFSAPVAQKG